MDIPCLTSPWIWYCGNSVCLTLTHLGENISSPLPFLRSGQNALGCELNGMRLEEGQTFRPSCAQLCHCLGGGVTCVPLCTDDLQMPPANCPRPHLVRLSGQCCKEWLCDGWDNSIYPDPLGGKWVSMSKCWQET